MRTIKLAVVAVVAAALLAVPASAQNWGTGTFTGKARPSYGNDRPKTNVTLVARGTQVRVKALKLLFHCSTDDNLPERLPVRVSSKFVPVKAGPAGGGAVVKLHRKVKRNGKTYKVDGDVNLGLRTTKILGIAGAYLMDPRGSAVCNDDVIFTARPR
jgi:hypothetical protein